MFKTFFNSPSTINTSFFPLLAWGIQNKKNLPIRTIWAPLYQLGRIPNNKPQIGNGFLWIGIQKSLRSPFQVEIPNLSIFGSKKDQAVQGISQVAGALDQSKMIKIKQHYTYNIKHVSLIKSRTLKSKRTVPPHPLGVDFWGSAQLRSLESDVEFETHLPLFLDHLLQGLAVRSAGWHYDVPHSASPQHPQHPSVRVRIWTSTPRISRGTMSSHLESRDTKGLHPLIDDAIVTQVDACHGGVRLQSFS